MSHSPRIILLMGVAGSGKTTVGRLLAAALNWLYLEADDFHSPANKAKMNQGVPLDDTDRAPWLAAIRARMDQCLANGQCAVVTCSALKEKYRHVLMDGTTAVSLVYLQGDRATIQARVSQREGHFLKADLVQSQFEVLEVPAQALVVDIGEAPEILVGKIRQALG